MTGFGWTSLRVWQTVWAYPDLCTWKSVGSSLWTTVILGVAMFDTDDSIQRVERTRDLTRILKVNDPLENPSADITGMEQFTLFALEESTLLGKSDDWKYWLWMAGEFIWKMPRFSWCCFTRISSSIRIQVHSHFRHKMACPQGGHDKHSTGFLKFRTIRWSTTEMERSRTIA